MSGDSRDNDDFDDLARGLRSAALPELPAGAPRRIADEAWRRAAERDGFRRGSGRGRWRRTRRFAVAACLVVAAGIGTLALQSTEPAFAVDGDPVQVWDGLRWESAREVETGSLVFVPEGVRTLRGRDGSRIDPLPGACFRLEADALDLRICVQVLSGRTEVLGQTLRLEVGDVSVEPENPVEMRVDVALESDGPAGPPADPVTATWHGTPLIRAGGRVRLLQQTTGRSLSLQPAEAATLVRVGDASPPQLARVEPWSSAVPEQIAAGRFVVSLDTANDRVVTYGDDSFACVLLPAASKLDALQRVNEAALSSLAFLSEMRVREVEDLGLRMTTSVTPRRELRFEKDGKSVVVRILESGEASVQRGSGRPEVFPSVAALREADSEAEAVFGKLLRD